MNDAPEGIPAEAALPEGPASVPIDRRLLEILVCPVTRGPLTYDAERQELVSKAANRAYPIHNGIPVMLVDEARVLED
jgi:uncharacterized protein YbaR (Trm112 family)